MKENVSYNQLTLHETRMIPVLFVLPLNSSYSISRLAGTKEENTHNGMYM